MNRVLLTGATGFLGRHVAEALAARRYEVHAVSRGLLAGTDAVGGRVHSHLVDLFDSRSVEALMAEVRPHGLVHLAWTTMPGAYWTDVSNELWTSASRRCFEAFASHGGRRIVVAGTSAEYAWTSDTPLDEALSPVVPASLYGISKNALRLHLEEWAPRAGVSWAWGRLFNIYGPFEHPRRLIPRSILSLLADRRIPFDDGLLIRDFLHVADAADAFATIYRHTYTGVVNVASGEGVSVRDVLTLIAHYLGRPKLVEFGVEASRSGEPRSLVGSSRVLRDIVGWCPRLTLPQGLAQTCDWWAGRR